MDGLASKQTKPSDHNSFGNTIIDDRHAPATMMLPEPSGSLENMLPWPFALVLTRMGMAVAMGIFVGLEREHSQRLASEHFPWWLCLGAWAV